MGPRPPSLFAPKPRGGVFKPVAQVSTAPKPVSAWGRLKSLLRGVTPTPVQRFATKLRKLPEGPRQKLKQLTQQITQQMQAAARETLGPLLAKMEKYPVVHGILTKVRDNAALGKKLVSGILIFTPVGDLLVIWVFQKIIPEKYQAMLKAKIQELIKVMDENSVEVNRIMGSMQRAMDAVAEDEFHFDPATTEELRNSIVEAKSIETELADAIANDDTISQSDYDAVWAAAILEKVEKFQEDPW